jgi:DNA-directed RNA polymerase subunit beta
VVLGKRIEGAFGEINSIKDFTGKNLELFFGDYYLDKPKYDEKTAKERNTTFEAPLYVSVKLVNKVTGKTKTQDVYLGDFPLMTPRGTFVINGVERVVVSQLVKSPGVFFTGEWPAAATGMAPRLFQIAELGWKLKLTSTVSSVSKLTASAEFPITALMRVFKFGSDEEILAAFADVDTNPDMRYIQNTLEKDPSKNADEGFKEVYKRIRPGDLATVDNARSFDRSDVFPC